MPSAGKTNDNVVDGKQLPIGRWRFRLLWLALIAMACVLIARGWQLTVGPIGEEWQKRRDRFVVREQRHQDWRGDIYASNGALLAGNATSWKVGFDASCFVNRLQRRAEGAGEAGDTLLLDAQEFLKKAEKILVVKHNLYRYAQQNPNSSYRPIALKKESFRDVILPVEKLMEEYGYPCFNIQSYARRIYPSGATVAHAAGLVDPDNRPLSGAEKWFNEHLQSRAGLSRYTRGETGVQGLRQIIDWRTVESPTDGRTVTLTIDQRAQYVTYKTVLKAWQKHGAKSASAVVFDARSGGILAMVSVPSYNPNKRAKRSQENLINRVLSDKIEPGSTVKPATILAGLEAGAVTMNTTVSASKKIAVGNYVVTDPRRYGVLNAEGVLRKSSNVGAIKLGQRAGKRAVWEMHRRLGWGRVNPIHSFGSPDVRSLEHHDAWSKTDFLARLYGYGFTLDLLDLARLYLAIANNGVMQTPHIWEKAIPEPASQRVIDRRNAYLIRNALARVTEDGGTAPLARVPGFTVAGKTGTVRKKIGGRYHYHALFAGMIPANHTRLVMLVHIEHDREENNYHGGESAAPVFSQVMGQLVRIYGIIPDSQNQDR